MAVIPQKGRLGTIGIALGAVLLVIIVCFFTRPNFQYKLLKIWICRRISKNENKKAAITPPTTKGTTPAAPASHSAPPADGGRDLEMGDTIALVQAPGRTETLPPYDANPAPPAVPPAARLPPYGTV
ncbi:MAG: hypothetical protein M1832_002990 [Thelocarpon impressellum]|nr:MAG: hypothetical protein M1832_002990 [Thelocarpon impressellum]